MTRGRGRRCVLACVVAGLLVAALRRVSGALPPRRWRSDLDGGAGVSVRTRPDPHPGSRVAGALRGPAVCVQPGRGAGDGGDEPAEGGSVLRPSGPISSRRRCRGRPTACGNRGTRRRTPSRRGGRKTPREAYPSGLANLATALGNWNASKNGTPRGPKVRFPKFKGKRHSMSCRFTTGAFGLANPDRGHVKLP